MANQFLHIGFNFVNPPDRKALDDAFDKGLDWVRYADSCYIVWTSSDVEKWYKRLKPFLKLGEHLFIVGIDIENRQGWLPKWVWEWINKERT